MPHPHRNNGLMLSLTAFSLLCLMILVGGFVYSGGSLLPYTQHAGTEEALGIWIMWGTTVALPLVTSLLWVLRLSEGRKD